MISSRIGLLAAGLLSSASLSAAVDGTAPPFAPLFATTYTPAQSVNWRTEPDGTIVTWGSGRARSRHESEHIFYTFPIRYHEHRTFGFEIHDRVAAGGNVIEIYYSPQYAHWRQPECRSAYGNPYRAAFNNNATFNPTPVAVANPDGTGQKWVCRITRNAHAGSDGVLRVGDWMEVEFQQFLGIFQGDPVVQGQTVYYTDTYRFRIGHPGLYIDGDEVLNAKLAAGGAATAPFVRAGETVAPSAVIAQQGDLLTYRNDANQVVTHRILDGLGNYDTYVVDSGIADYTAFFREALNIRWDTHNAFLHGRRLFHSSFRSGAHFEPGNPAHTGVAGLAGGLTVQESCIACHVHNGRGSAPANGQPLQTLAVKVSSGVADANGLPLPHALFGDTLQPRSLAVSIPVEPIARVTFADEPGSYGDGQPFVLQRPGYEFVDSDDRIFASAFQAQDAPGRAIAFHSARMPQTVAGLGLLEAVDEETLLQRHDPNDADGDGISGRVALVPTGGLPQIGRFGWKADKASLRQFTAAALRAEIGVKSSLRPTLDCTPSQTACTQQAQNAGTLTDADLALITIYVQMTGAPARRPDTVELPQVVAGEAVFHQLGCGGCHAPTLQTGYRHPLAELRGQTIRAYTDLLLHDLGDGLADRLLASGTLNREWRTPPLWGLGLRDAVNGHGRLLHDGRARDLPEAILWHGGEASASREAFRTLPATSRAALIAFLDSL
ncbi:MAG TPA: di-heme oxidoredictase family protein [Tahibacter sp.]|uniref:di-heme oxidoredictase family protein n=1 Tax=Tahibacter sp. TaxID=2056211 RepID=UPI002C31FE55|nr:di-heme oxidoredictase family protein [Tahibacter sp.]HSX58782.1 di-heme oxidoredictase family protein [Tahibacter sp.]